MLARPKRQVSRLYRRVTPAQYQDTEAVAWRFPGPAYLHTILGYKGCYGAKDNRFAAIPLERME